MEFAEQLRVSLRIFTFLMINILFLTIRKISVRSVMRTCLMQSTRWPLRRSTRNLTVSATSGKMASVNAIMCDNYDTLDMTLYYIYM